MPLVRRRLLTLPLLLGALLACKQLDKLRGEERRESPRATSTATAVPVPPANTPPPAIETVAPLPAAPTTPPPPTPGQLFAGAPAPETTFMRLLPLRQAGVHVREPVGWKGHEEYYDGLMYLWSRDEAAMVMINSGFSGSPGDAQVNLWTKSMQAKGVTYGPPEPGKLGKDFLPATVAVGRGTRKGKDAEFWALDVELSRKSHLLVIAVLAADASEQRRQELIACVRSIYKV